MGFDSKNPWSIRVHSSYFIHHPYTHTSPSEGLEWKHNQNADANYNAASLIRYLVIPNTIYCKRKMGKAVIHMEFTSYIIHCRLPFKSYYSFSYVWLVQKLNDLVINIVVVNRKGEKTVRWRTYTFTMSNKSDNRWKWKASLNNSSHWLGKINYEEAWKTTEIGIFNNIQKRASKKKKKYVNCKQLKHSEFGTSHLCVYVYSRIYLYGNKCYSWFAAENK